MKPLSSLIAVLIALLAACTPPASVSSVNLTSTDRPVQNQQVRLDVTRSATFSASVTGTGSFNNTVTWRLFEDDGSLTRTGNTAILTPKKTGQYTITATSQANPAKSASLIVVVSQVNTVEVTADKTLVGVNTPVQLDAFVGGLGDLDTSVNWNISPNPSGINLQGNTPTFSTSTPGTYTLTAVSAQNPAKQDAVQVRVVDKSGVEVTPNLSNTNTNLPASLTATVAGVGGGVQWSVEGNSSGTSFTPPTGNNTEFRSSFPGSYVIVATSLLDPSKQGVAEVRVSTVSSVSIANVSSVLVNPNQTSLIEASLTGQGPINEALTWSVQPASATLSPAGPRRVNFSAASNGVYTITATSVQDPSKKASTNVTVATVNGVTVTVPVTKLMPGGTVTLNASVNGSSGFNPNVTWSASGGTLAPNGNTASFTIPASGTYTVTATSVQDTTRQASQALTVAQWAGTKLAGSSAAETMSAVATDAVNGSVYVVGSTEGSLGGSQGQSDAFIARFDASGTHLWTRQLGSNADDFGLGVAVDASGNAYMVGSSFGNLPGATNSGTGTTDAFIARYDAGGTLQWVREFGTTSAASEEVVAVTVDAGGAVLVAGTTDDRFTGFTNPDVGTLDVFLAKFDGSGNRTWLRQFGEIGNDTARGIGVDASDNVYVTGSTEGNLSGLSVGGTDAFVARYSSAGAPSWVRQFGTPDFDEARSLVVSGVQVYAAGETDGNLSGTNQGSADAFVAQFAASSGTPGWTQQLGGSGFDRANGITVDASGNLYIAGSTDGALLTQSSAGSTDLFTAQYTSGGVRNWVRQLGSGQSDWASAVASDRQGGVIVVGATEGNLDGQANTGVRDGFALGYDQSGNRR
jgi:hypothetical protein